MNVLHGLTDFMAELDHRKARVLAMDLEVDAGVDIAFDGATGGLAVEIDLGSDAISANVAENDFALDSSESIEESFSTVFNGLVGGILGDALGDMSFSLPGFSGIGLTAMTIAPAGDSGDWLGGFTWLGEVSYASTGCAEDGSLACGDTDGGGCTDAEGAGCEGGGCTAPEKSAPLALARLPCAVDGPATTQAEASSPHQTIDELFARPRPSSSASFGG